VRGALGKAPGVSKIDIEVGQDDFTVHYDPAKTKPAEMLKLLQADEPDAKIIN